jgi:hypothetical protein
MAEDLDQLRSGFRQAIMVAASALADAQAAFDRLCACVEAPTITFERPDLGLTDLIPIGEAADLAKRAKSTMGRWCRANKIDGDKGFARQIGKRWWVSQSRLLRHLASGSRD